MLVCVAQTQRLCEGGGFAMFRIIKIQFSLCIHFHKIIHVQQHHSQVVYSNKCLLYVTSLLFYQQNVLIHPI